MISEFDLKTQIYVHTPRNMAFFKITKPEIHTGKKTLSSTNGTGQPGQLQVEECK